MNKLVGRRSAFTLIELLTVVGIIGLLVGILLPSLSAARTSARKAKVKVQLDSIGKVLEAFNNDVGDYPESAKKPDPIDVTNDPLGRTVNHPGNETTLYGAQSLVRALNGADLKGYVAAKRAREYDPSLAPTEWYDVRSTNFSTPDYESPFPRESKYFNEAHSIWRTAATLGEDALKGIRPSSGSITSDNDQYVMVDAWEYPILYYKANPRGTFLCDNTTQGGAGADAFPIYDPDNIPFYNLLDNDVFTGSMGTGFGNGSTSNEPGWRFGIEFHPIRILGNIDDPDDVSGLPGGITMPFARYIHDHKSEQASVGSVKPVNPDTYLLISAGPDGIYGTNDDINNFQER